MSRESIDRFYDGQARRWTHYLVAQFLVVAGVAAGFAFGKFVGFFILSLAAAVLIRGAYLLYKERP